MRMIKDGGFEQVGLITEKKGGQVRSQPMSMDVGSGDGPKSEINVTPLVDVVLVLLIIFMVVQPLLQRGYDVQVPPNAPPTPPNTPPPTDQIIVSITANKEYYLNKEKVEPANIALRLRRSSGTAARRSSSSPPRTPSSTARR